MALKDYRNDYYTHSGKASDVARQLALAGLALVWIFKVEKLGPVGIPAPLILPAALFVCTLALDLLQYALAAAIWGGFHRYYEYKQTDQDADIIAPGYLNWPSIVCFWSKLIIVLVGYVISFKYIYEQLPHS